MTETVDIEEGWHSAESSAEELAERRFRLAVAGLTLLPALFLILRLTAWPPHEDETLALFVGRHSLGDLFGVVLDERGGAPLHFLVAWAVAHLGLGLEGLRAASALFAVASVPVIAALVRRLSDRRTALVATALVVASWMLLFHGVYGRMYSLFLLTSALSYLALLVVCERGGVWRWGLWVLAILAVVATHPYGALVLASQGVYVLLGARHRLRGAVAAFVAVAALGIPFWLTDLVLAGRFDVGVGGGGEKLSGPVSVMNYLADTLGDFTAGWPPTVALAVVGTVAGIVLLGRRRPRTAILIGCAGGVPVAAFLAARLGGNTSPESRHLIFVLPFVALALATALLELVARHAAAGWGLLAVLLVAEVAWGWHKTPPLFEGEPSSRTGARAEASDWLARTSRPNDVLFGYDPLFLGAWERNGDFSSTVVPRADVTLALTTMRKADKPLGRGVWVFDSSDTNNFAPSPTIRLVSPQPSSDFEARTFGPFLVIRTRDATRTPANYFRQARRAQLVGKALYLGDADINYQTVVRAGRRLGLYTPRSRSISSR